MVGVDSNSVMSGMYHPQRRTALFASEKYRQLSAYLQVKYFFENIVLHYAWQIVSIRSDLFTENA